MTEKRKYHPLVTSDAVQEARQYVRSDVTDDEIAELMSGTFEMLESWSRPEVQ